MRILLVIAMTVSTAYAQPPKYTRKQDVKIDVKQTARTRPLAPPDNTATPVRRPDDIMLAEERAQPIRDEQAQVLEKLVRETPDTDDQKPDLLFRLAEHYAQQMHLWHLKSVDLELRAQKAR